MKPEGLQWMSIGETTFTQTCTFPLGKKGCLVRFDVFESGSDGLLLSHSSIVFVPGITSEYLVTAANAKDEERKPKSSADILGD